MTEINNNTVLRWIIYIGTIVVSYVMWRDIVKNFKFPINNLMWCPGFGAVVRCDSISGGCFVSILTAIICLIANYMSTISEGTILSIIGRFETGLCLTQLIMWGVIFVYMIKWTMQTGAFYSGDSEFAVLFCYAIMLICLFYMAMLISFTEMAHRDASEE